MRVTISEFRMSSAELVLARNPFLNGGILLPSLHPKLLEERESKKSKLEIEDSKLETQNLVDVVIRSRSFSAA